MIDTVVECADNAITFENLPIPLVSHGGGNNLRRTPPSLFHAGRH